jgi:membrane-associated protease RseP (regulator of RpoE activity)
LSGTIAIVAFFVGLLLIILIHEGGHYLAARAFGFRVLEYFVGFGPRVWSVRRGEIEYGVKAIPAGGYVKIAGMNPLVDDVPPGDEHRAYFAKPIRQRAVVILAGPLSHLLVAGLVFTSLYLVVGDLSRVAKVGGVTPRIGGRPAPAAEAGLRAGDVIVRIGDIENPTPQQLGAYQEDHAGEPIRYTIQRGQRRFDVTMTPVIERIDGEPVPRIGVLLAPTPLPLAAAVTSGFGDVWDLSVYAVSEIGRVFGPEGIGRIAALLFTDAPRRIDDPASVVGIGRQVGVVGSEGDWDHVVYLFGYVTLFIGLINLVPLPPFDGGHLAILAIERVRGRPVDLKRVVPVSVAVLAFMATFVLAAVVLDVTKPIPTGP